MDATAEWRVETDAPVPHLVAESLHEKGAVIRHGAGCGRLVVQVLEQVLDREVVESGALAQPLRRCGGTHAAQLAHHLAERSAKLRSEERRVGKGGRSWWSRESAIKKK